MNKLLIVALSALTMPALAAFPEKPVRMIVPLAAGGGMDTTARSLATPLGERLGQTVVVDNRPGGGGNVGVDIMREAPADGHTLFMGSATFVIHPLLYKARYVPTRDFAPITQVTRQPYVLIVHPSVAAKTVKELVAYTKANPNMINYASSGQGSLIHLATELFKVRTGADMTHIPFKDGRGLYRHAGRPHPGLVPEHHFGAAAPEDRQAARDRGVEQTARGIAARHSQRAGNRRARLRRLQLVRPVRARRRAARGDRPRPSRSHGDPENRGDAKTHGARRFRRRF